MKILLPILALFFASCQPPEETKILTGESMGTTWKVAWRGATAPGMEKKITETLAKWEGVMSQWQPDSDLSRFNCGEPATADLQRVIDLAEEIHEASGRAFDHRLLKETGEAGFGPGGNGIDLSAIGKGFAVDMVGEALRKIGVTDFVFELGGEILSGDGEWEVAIEKPDPATQETRLTMMLKNRERASPSSARLPPSASSPRTAPPPTPGPPLFSSSAPISRYPRVWK